MKAIFLKTGVLTGIFLMLAVAGNAQSSQLYRAEIPFDFQMKDASYAAGNFEVGPISAGALALTEKATGRTKILGVGGVGGDTSSEKGKLIFNKLNGVYTLSEVRTPTFGLRIRPSKRAPRSHRIAGNETPKTETVVVLLTN